MPDLFVNGDHSSIKSPKQEPIDKPVFTLEDNGENSEIDGPPFKKRRVTTEPIALKSSPRPVSPPWKKFSAEGPTSFVQNGRRKSGRTNLIPLEQQPHTGRRQTRAAFDKITDKHARPVYSNSNKKKNKSFEKPLHQGIVKSAGQPPVRRGPGRPPKVKTDAKRRLFIDVPTINNQRRRLNRTANNLPSTPNLNGAHETPSDSEQTEWSSLSSSPPLTLQKVKLRVALPKLSVAHPANIAQPKKHSTFTEFFENDLQEPFAGQELLNEEQILREALSRHRVHAAENLGQIRIDGTSASTLDRQDEPQKQYAHYDHLVSHIIHFRSLLRQEHKDHRKRAEQLAYEAKRYVENKRKKGRVKTAEELQQELIDKTRAQYRAVAKDLERLWLSVGAEVNAMRLRQYEEEQQAKIKGHLNRVLERTDLMLQRQDSLEVTTDMEIESIGNSSEDANSSESDSEDMSATSSDSDSDDEQHDPDAGLTAEELHTKYGNIPDIQQSDEKTDALDPLNHTDDSDPETEMDSEFDTDDSNERSSDDGTEEGGETETDDGLMSLFFSKKQISQMATSVEDDAVEQNDRTSGGSDFGASLEPTSNHLIEEVDNGPDFQQSNDAALDLVGDSEMPDHSDLQPEASMLASEQTSPQTSVTKQSAPESTSSIELATQADAAETKREDKSSIKTPIPPLLRGTLREYQHEGLDWLANLYGSGRSGILADEMGLGKTIQSISLLAHLATEYEVWGPHLIVVPTSVMLNWEMEFKKFLPGFKILTYYGTLEERKQKRRGWMANDSFNVCITSYQLVLQDANSFKRRKWHYMILDEAHNIKNFRSERWQTMMTFNTRARLLLTGTPLQNNLTELWSLLFFLHYGQEGEDNDDAFAGLKEWSEWFKRPVESILEHGRQILDEEDKEQVAKLHKVIRPYLLRRLKADVEKQMPAKYEHVEMCRLSKRQRQLYDGFMSRAQTKETLASGNYLSIINALMQLRKVCNHPDLFETRPINTSFAIPKSVAAEFEIKDLLLRRKMFRSGPFEKVDLDFLQLIPISNEEISAIENIERLRYHAYGPIKALRDSQWSRIDRQAVSSGHRDFEVLHTLENVGRRARLQDLDRSLYYEAYRHHLRPVYGRRLLRKLHLDVRYEQLSRSTGRGLLSKSWAREHPLILHDLVQSIQMRCDQMQPFVEHYACVTPAAVALDLNTSFLTELTSTRIKDDLTRRPDPFHNTRMKLSIAFPDKRLLQYDCGKLQRLDKLLRQLQAGGHRALIFTQMTKVLDILEQFLNIHGHRYLRLDGATKIEQRQILTDRFNNDPRILAFILSSRSGGLGINLTGADTVIFYDLDWNPAMDRQCTDRAHRIGQTRDVHIYRFVSEHTIESNILRKANQKQMLDDVVIQEGDFTTDYKNRLTYQDMLDDNTENDMAGAAFDRVLGNEKTAVDAFEQAEDREDASAAKVAAKEIQHADAGDFEDRAVATPRTGEAGTPGPYGTAINIPEGVEDGHVGHVDDYLLRLQTYLLRDVPLFHRNKKPRRGRKKEDHRKRRPR